jgi:hypothetical protein
MWLTTGSTKYKDKKRNENWDFESVNWLIFLLQVKGGIGR